MRTVRLLPGRPPALAALLLLAAQAAAAQDRFRIFPPGDKPGPLLYGTLVGLALFTTLAVHELGHLAAGLLQGFRFELFVVGPLGFKRTPAGIRPFLNRDVGLMGGAVATVPVSQSPGNRRKVAWVLLSGPGASLGLAVTAALLFTASTSGAARGYWLVTAVCSVAILLATTLPRKSGLFFTDRARFQRLMSKGRAGETEAALLSILTQEIIEGNVKNIPLEKARLLQTDEDATMRFWGAYYAYAYFRDNGLTEAAEGEKAGLEAFREQLPRQLWKMLKLDERPAGAGESPTPLHARE
jgi:hypothetical protein